jgi:hypothetical protein
MSDYVILVVFWLVPLLAIAAYLFTRRLLRHSRSLFLFDSAVLCLVALLCVGFWWREITGHISKDIWLDEYEFMALLVPMWTSIISVPFLLLAAAVRLFIFSKAQSDGTRTI